MAAKLKLKNIKQPQQRCGISEEDLCSFVSSNTIKYLREKIHFELISWKKTGKHRGFAFATIPTYAHKYSLLISLQNRNDQSSQTFDFHTQKKLTRETM